VIRTFAVGDPVAGITLEALLHVFLQQGLVVFLVPILQNFIDLRNEKIAYEGSHGLEPRIQIVGADNGFHGIGNQCLFRSPPGVLFSLADQDKIVQAQDSADFRQAVLAHHVGLDLGHVPFGLVR